MNFLPAVVVNDLTETLGFTFLMTTLGASLVFFFKENVKENVQKIFLGFAAGVMIAASVWSLLLPSISIAEENGNISWIPASVGFLLGIFFLLFLDLIIPHLHNNEETPEGPNIGLINSLGTYAKINEFGFIESPYRKVDKENRRVTDEIHYLTADEEDLFIRAQANEPLDENDGFVNNRVVCRTVNGAMELVPTDKVDYMDISPKQVVSIATAMIPFLENDDANRALMGSNMQRQAVPLVRREAPVIGTGVEYRAAKDSGAVVVAKNSGIAERVTADEIIIKREDGNKDKYKLLKFKRSNQGTCINQTPIINRGDKIEAGDVIADGPSTEMGEVALGRNCFIAFMTWEGYNYEDAILINERLVKEDRLSTIHNADRIAVLNEGELVELGAHNALINIENGLNLSPVWKNHHIYLLIIQLFFYF